MVSLQVPLSGTSGAGGKDPASAASGLGVYDMLERRTYAVLDPGKRKQNPVRGVTGPSREPELETYAVLGQNGRARNDSVV